MQGEGCDVLSKFGALGPRGSGAGNCPDSICIPTTPGMEQEKKPSLGSTSGVSPEPGRGRGWGAAPGAFRAALFRLCPPTPPGWAERGGSNLQTIAAWLQPMGAIMQIFCCDPPQSRCPTTEAPSQQIQWESVKDAMQSSAVPRAQPRGDAVALNATAAIPCSPFASI